MSITGAQGADHMSTHTVEYPPWAEHAIWMTRSASYAFAALTGVGALLFTPASLKSESYIIVGTMLVFGIICFLASVFKRYIVEWISLFFLTGGISIYVTAVWISAIGKPMAIAGASIFTVLVLLMVVRLIELTVFWRRNVKTAKLSQELGCDN